MKAISRIGLTLFLFLLASSTFTVLTNAQTPEADIKLTVTTSTDKVMSGAPVSYLYNATNTGETPLTGAIYDYTFGPVGSFVNLQPDGWVGFNVTHTITQNTSNTATAYGIDQYGSNVTDSDSAFVEVYSGADIKLTVTSSKTKVIMGASVSYLYNATNTGETALTGAIYDYTFGPVGSFVNLQPGGWVGFNVTHTIMQNTSNTALAYGLNQFGTNVTDSDSAFAEVYSGVDIKLTVTVSETKVVAGTPVSYLYNATNTGEVPLTGNITDATFGLVGGFVNLQPNGWVGFNVTHTITQNTSNTATAYGFDQYKNLATDTDSAFVEVYYPTAGISLTKAPSATKVVAGTPVSYLYNATNTGETALTGGIYDDQFGPVGSFVNLQPGGWVGFNVTHVITENTTNTATVWGVDEFGANVTDSATAFVQVIRIPQVIPEVPLGTVIAGAAMIIAFGAYKTRKPKTPKQQ